MKGGHPLHLAGEEVVLLGQRALFWPRRATLVVADLHWGKAESFRATGLPLPAAVAEGVLAADLERLDRALAATAARRLLVLGDLIHARDGVTPALSARVAAWRRTLDPRGVESLELVPGNHDRHLARLPAEWRVDVLPPAVDEGPFRFTHAPPAEGNGAEAAAPAPYVLAGHVHPVARLRGGGDSLRLPCFHLGPRVGVLPAFSDFTGGQRLGRGGGDRVFVVVEGRVVEV